MPKKNNTTSDDASGLGHVVDPTPFLVKPGSKVSLRGFDPDSIGNFTSKKQAEEALSEDVKALAVAQDLLYASNTYSILIILQALDAAGKDGMIEHVMSGSILRAATSSASSSRHTRSSITTFSGAAARRCQHEER